MPVPLDREAFKLSYEPSYENLGDDGMLEREDLQQVVRAMPIVRQGGRWLE